MSIVGLLPVPVRRAGPGRVRGTASRVLAVVGAVAVVVALVLLVAPGGQPVVRPVFDDEVRVAESAWGDEDALGAQGSWVLGYEDGTVVGLEVPWDGGDVTDARLGAGPVDLATVVAADAADGVLRLEVLLDGCEYFHEREMQVLPTITVTGVDGGTTVLRLDRPLLVRSPMLWQCPDRLVDRQANDRSDL